MFVSNLMWLSFLKNFLALIVNISSYPYILSCSSHKTTIYFVTREKSTIIKRNHFSLNSIMNILLQITIRNSISTEIVFLWLDYSFFSLIFVFHSYSWKWLITLQISPSSRDSSISPPKSCFFFFLIIFLNPESDWLFFYTQLIP